MPIEVKTLVLVILLWPMMGYCIVGLIDTQKEIRKWLMKAPSPIYALLALYLWPIMVVAYYRK